MKKRFLFLILIPVLLNTSCTIHDTSFSPESQEGINGSGDVVTETRILPDFHSVHISTAGKVYLTYGTEQQVSVSADSNILQYITTIVNNRKLTIGVKPDVQLSNFNLTVNVTMKDIEELVASSAGDIIGKNKFKADFVNLILCSAGDISLELEADQLNSSLSSAGDLYLSGSVVKHHAVLSSAGDLRAFNLVTDTTVISLSSAGDAEVFASRLLDVTISSVGSLYYKGNPTIHQTITSKGRVIDSN